MNTPDRADGAAVVPSRGLGAPILGIAARVAIGSAAAGAALSLVDPTRDGVFYNVLYAECIGLSIFGFYAATRWRRRLDARRPLRDPLLRFAVAIPLGFVVGVTLASWLTGRGVGLAVFSHIAPFAFVVTGVCSVGFFYFFWSRNRLAEAAAAHADALRTTAEARLGLLQAQIEPHMLFNTLANLRTLVEVDPRRAQTMIDELIVYLRATLAASRKPTATLDEEFAQLRAYLELMQVRMAHRLRYTLQLPDALRDATIPPMLLQPLVENAIKHGLEPKIDGGAITVVAQTSDGMLHVEVRDDGVGVAAPASDAGYGLAHVRERLHVLYGDAATMTVDARATGFVVSLALPR